MPDILVAGFIVDKRILRELLGEALRKTVYPPYPVAVSVTALIRREGVCPVVGQFFRRKTAGINTHCRLRVRRDPGDEVERGSVVPYYARSLESRVTRDREERRIRRETPEHNLEQRLKQILR